jgi:phenylalanyl-tRNA synthetase beta chain
MNISLNWLTDYVDVAMPAAELGELFTRIGLNCEGIEETDADIVFDLEVTSNRPDLLGHLGVARELAAATGAEFTPPSIGELSTRGQASDLTDVRVEAPDLCPRYTARVLRGVKIGPSPDWLVERLEAVGLRSVNNVVDVTNFVLMEYSQPLHSFDYDKLEENRIVVRRAREGEQLTSIDETICKLDPSMLVIADASKPVAIAGIMGGLDTEVTTATTNILLESAQFDPLTTRRTSRTLGLMSESNYRFERGIDPVRLDEASLRACRLILDLAGGTLAEGLVDVWAEPYQPPRVTLRPSRCDALLGLEIAPRRQVEILASLGLSPELSGQEIRCTIPSHRADLTREADLIEEVGRIEGFDNIPLDRRIMVTPRPEGQVQKTRRRVGELVAAAGFDEAVTFSFVDQSEAALFGFDKTIDVRRSVRRTNNALRPTLTPSLLRAVKGNQDAGTDDVSLYELATVFRHVGQAELPEQHTELALVTTRDLRDLRGAIEAVGSRLLSDVEIEVVQEDAPGYEPGAAARIALAGRTVGHLGYIDPKVQDHYGLERRVAAATVSFEAILQNVGHVRTYEPVAKFPPVRRDLSLLVEESVTWAQLATAIDDVPQPLRSDVSYVTTYRGKQIPDDRKSVTLTLTYRSPEGTLRGEQVDEQVDEVVAALKQKLSAELRA